MPRPPLAARFAIAALFVHVLFSFGCAAPARVPPPPTLSPETHAKLQADLDAAERALAAAPGSEDAAIWFGRRLGYLGRYTDAIDAFTRALGRHPESYRLLRHRAHRYITVRQLDRAIADLTRAWSLAQWHPDAIEPDGAPTPGPPTPPRSTDRSNILYHLALAHYLRAEYRPAERFFALAADLPLTNDDNRVACAHWRWLALQRLGDRAAAAALLATISPAMDVRENHSYHRLLLRYQSPPADLSLPAELPVTDPGYAYGVAAHLAVLGHPVESAALLRRIVNGTNPAAFGHIAAEADLASLGARRAPGNP